MSALLAPLKLWNFAIAMIEDLTTASLLPKISQSGVRPGVDAQGDNDGGENYKLSPDLINTLNFRIFQKLFFLKIFLYLC